MKTIFRAINIHSGRLVCGNIIQRDENYFIVTQNPDKTLNIIPVFNTPIMRPVRTTLTGEMIFEHDVIHYAGGDFVVGYNYKKHRFIVITKGGEGYNDLSGIQRCEILGNVYETEKYKSTFNWLFVPE